MCIRDRDAALNRIFLDEILKKLDARERQLIGMRYFKDMTQTELSLIHISFFDPTLVNYLDISEDPIPTFRKLMKEYSSGYYKVPSVGAGTANTEFESITGMSMHYFGPGEYPYKSILRETTCESAPYVPVSYTHLSYTDKTGKLNKNENYYVRAYCTAKDGTRLYGWYWA